MFMHQTLPTTAGNPGQQPNASPAAFDPSALLGGPSATPSSTPPRRLPRHGFDGAVLLARADADGQPQGPPFSGTAQDLSLYGLCVTCRETLAVGDRLLVTFELPGRTPPWVRFLAEVRNLSPLADGRHAAGCLFVETLSDC